MKKKEEETLSDLKKYYYVEERKKQKTQLDKLTKQAKDKIARMLKIQTKSRISDNGS